MATLHEPMRVCAGTVRSGEPVADGRRSSTADDVAAGATSAAGVAAATAEGAARPVRATMAEAATAVRALRRVDVRRRVSIHPVCAAGAPGSTGLCRAPSVDPAEPVSVRAGG